jgi:pyruvate dehydrogenase E2 component (dihydrolipoamide acetyltransferase)
LAKEVIMPALGMAQETGTLIRWLKAAGESVVKGEPLMEVETDKAAVEVEASASGVLSAVRAAPGDVIPVGQRIAWILAPGEQVPAEDKPAVDAPPQPVRPAAVDSAPARLPSAPVAGPVFAAVTPLAARLAAENKVDLTRVKPQGGQVRKEDVLAFLNDERRMKNDEFINPHSSFIPSPARIPASPKARRLALERGLDLGAVPGTGPAGAVLAADVPPSSTAEDVLPASRVWRVMAERLSQAWTTIPHFYLIREVNASALKRWQADLQSRTDEKITVTDLLVHVIARALRRHPRLNSSWRQGTVVLHREINLGLAVAVEDGLIVPVIHHADELQIDRLAARRRELVSRAQAGKLSLDDLSAGTFTLSNLGMYGVDAFNAIVNPPQAAILAAGRIADRVVPVDGQPAVQPMITFSLSCDHRAVDGARGAGFLQTLADLVEQPYSD